MTAEGRKRSAVLCALVELLTGGERKHCSTAHRRHTRVGVVPAAIGKLARRESHAFRRGLNKRGNLFWL